MNETDNRKEVKRKFALWIKQSTIDMVEGIYKEDNCSSRSEFIEKAIIFYVGYLSSNDNSQYLPNVVTSTLKSIVAESDNRMSRLIFKLAVELAMTMNIIVSSQDIDKMTLTKLRGECVKEVKLDLCQYLGHKKLNFFLSCQSLIFNLLWCLVIKSTMAPLTVVE